MRPLENILVIDFSQFLSGPSAGLRLADLGAEVIKIERPVTGDICRTLYVSDVILDEESSIFHALNRNKKSYAVDLKTAAGINAVKKLLLQADVLLHNFRPGVMEKLGLGYGEIAVINPGIVYAEISGYGTEGPWENMPGQDLLLQAVSGLTFLSGNKADMPTPMGVSVADILSGTQLTQGILAALYQKAVTGKGSIVQVSMLESVLDFQFEVLTCFYNDGNELPERSAVNNAHAYVAAPYGIYKTTSGFIALAMGNIIQLSSLLDCKPLLVYTDAKDWFIKRDEIKNILATHILTQSTQHWLSILEPADIWCAEVMDYDTLTKHEAYKVLQMEQQVVTASGLHITTTRCPIRIDGEIFSSPIAAPRLGENNKQLNERFGIENLSA